MTRRRHRDGYAPYHPYNRQSGSSFSSIFGSIFGYGSSTVSSPFSIFGNYQPLSSTKKILIHCCGVDILLAYPFILINNLIKINLSDDGLKLYNSGDNPKIEIIGIDAYDL